MQGYRLICIGHIQYSAQRRSVLHRHSFNQISYVLHGSGYVEYNEQTYRVHTGDVHIYQPWAAHDIWSNPHFGLETLDLRFLDGEAADTPDTAPMPTFLRSYTDPVLNLMRGIEREGAEKPGPMWKEMAHAYLIQLVVYLSRRRSKSCNQPLSPAAKAAEAMRRSLPAGVQIAELARRLFINPTHFATLFKAEFGKSPKEYMIELKIEYAKHVLTVCDAQPAIGRLARRLGWKDVRQFRSFFKQCTGMTPSTFFRFVQETRVESINKENRIVFDPDYVMSREYVANVT